MVTDTRNPLTLKERNCNYWPRNHFIFIYIKLCTRNDPDMNNLELLWMLPLTRNIIALCSISPFSRHEANHTYAGRPERVQCKAGAQNSKSSPSPNARLLWVQADCRIWNVFTFLLIVQLIVSLLIYHYSCPPSWNNSVVGRMCSSSTLIQQ